MKAELIIGVRKPGRFPAKFTRPKVVPDLGLRGKFWMYYLFGPMVIMLA